MGYTTYFEGQIKIDPPLNAKEIEYLQKFNETRRMKREKGPYYVGGEGFMGQDREEDVIDYNCPPDGQPGLWCQWIPTNIKEDDEGNPISADAIEWDDGEKFYYAIEWMEYLIDHFIGSNPIAKQEHPEEFAFLQGHTCNGEIFAEGEESDDRWKIVVEDNNVREFQGTVTVDYEEVF